jgi:hypothetical protein
MAGVKQARDGAVAARAKNADGRDEPGHDDVKI